MRVVAKEVAAVWGAEEMAKAKAAAAVEAEEGMARVKAR